MSSNKKNFSDNDNHNNYENINEINFEELNNKINKYSIDLKKK